MQTGHRVYFADSRDMHHLDDESVDLTVTSPPYPMIEMWDDTFTKMNAAIGDALDAEEGQHAFDLMHDELAKTWNKVARVTKPGGTVCINVGDATRKIGDDFELYPNHTRIVDWFRSNGFRVLPAIHWRKPTNSAAKFMGSGMLPPNQYVTLETEYILVFRKAGNRSFDAKSDDRYESAYFWEERNRWFSDMWTDVNGAAQALDGDEMRDRSAAYPLAIPYRLINMYSVYGDTVLDPFWGTGTTSLAAMASARNSVGYELDDGFRQAFERQLENLPAVTERINKERLDNHRRFVQERQEQGEELSYESEQYGFPVTTQQERRLTLRMVNDISREDGTYHIDHGVQ